MLMVDVLSDSFEIRKECEPASRFGGVGGIVLKSVVPLRPCASVKTTVLV